MLFVSSGKYINYDYLIDFKAFMVIVYIGSIVGEFYV